MLMSIIRRDSLDKLFKRVGVWWSGWANAQFTVNYVQFYFTIFHESELLKNDFRDTQCHTVPPILDMSFHLHKT